MSSNINGVAANIDITYPVAGQDNSSQGFRDNFIAIQRAFNTATEEVSSLQLTAVQVNQANDFQFNGSLLRARIQNSGYTSVTDETSQGTVNLDYTQGSYHQYAVNSSTTFQVTKTSWPAQANNIYAQLRVEATVASTATTINFAAPGGVLRTNSDVTLPYTYVSTGTAVWDLWTTDGGTTVFVNKVGTYS